MLEALVADVGEPDHRRATPELIAHKTHCLGIEEIAGEDDDIRFRAADLAGEIVQRRDQRRLDAIGLEERVQSNRGFDVGEGDQDAHTTSA